MLPKTITYLLYGLTLVLPLAFTTWTHELFEFPKFILLLFFAIALGLLATLDHYFSSKNPLKRIWEKASPQSKVITLSILTILVTQAIATLFSLHPHTSIWGYYGRFHQGLITTICYTIIYFVAFLYLDKKSTQNTIKITIYTSFLIGVYAILQRLGIDKNVWVQDVQNRVFATLGQPNWLAAYLLPTLFLTLYKGAKQKSFVLIYTVILIALIYTKSRSGLIGFGVSYIVYWLLLFRHTSFAKLQKSFAIYTSITFALILFLGTPFTPSLHSLTTPTPNKEESEVVTPVVEGGTESGEIRQIVWQGAWDLFLQNPVLGTGPETFAYTYYQTRPLAHNYVSEWDFLYNKAHNEYLNLAATTGLIGLLGYLFWHLALLLPILKKRPSKEDKLYTPVLVASLTSFFITNFFGFSVIPVYLLLTLLSAIASTHSQDTEEETANSKKNYLPYLIIALFLASLLPTRLYLADQSYALGKKQIQNQQSLSLGVENLTRAHRLWPYEALYLTTIGELFASSQEQDVQTEALRIAQEIYKLNPYHQNNLKSIAKIYLSLATTDKSYYLPAAEILEQAVKLAPTDPKLKYNLALVYTRLEDNDKAIEILQETISQRTIYPEPYYALILLLEETKQLELIPPLAREAKENLATYSAELKEIINYYQDN